MFCVYFEKFYFCVVCVDDLMCVNVVTDLMYVMRPPPCLCYLSMRMAVKCIQYAQSLMTVAHQLRSGCIRLMLSFVCLSVHHMCMYII